MTTIQKYDADIIGSSRAAIFLSMSLAQAERRTALVERTKMAKSTVRKIALSLMPLAVIMGVLVYGGL